MVVTEVLTNGGITIVLSWTRLYNNYMTLTETLSHLQVPKKQKAFKITLNYYLILT